MHNIIAIASKLLIMFKNFNLVDTQRITLPDATDYRVFK